MKKYIIFILILLSSVYYLHAEENKPEDELKMHIDKGNVFFNNNQYGEAKKEYMEVLKSSNGNAQIWFNLGTIFEYEGDLESSMESYKNYLVLSPGAKDARTISARVITLDGERLFKSEDYKEAINKFKDAIMYEPNYQAYFFLGLTYDKLEQYDPAIKSYENAIKIFPDCGEAHFNLAIHYEARGKYDKALRHYKEYLRIYPKASDSKMVKEWIAKLEKL
jgi:tetratricopeptide (TPR) repeat protein